MASDTVNQTWYKALAPYVEISDIDVRLQRPVRLRTGGSVDAVQGVFMRFPEWTGKAFVDDFGKKAAARVSLDGEHLFAELAVLRLLEKQEQPWIGRWVNTYSGKGEVWKYLTEWADVPRSQQRSRPIAEPGPRDLLSRIAEANAPGRFAGCWDTFVWRGSDYAFFECKRQAPRYKDVVSDKQEDWLRAALTLPNTPLTPSSFCFIQWDYRR